MQFSESTKKIEKTENELHQYENIQDNGLKGKSKSNSRLKKSIFLDYIRHIN